VSKLAVEDFSLSRVGEQIWMEYYKDGLRIRIEMDQKEIDSLAAVATDMSRQLREYVSYGAAPTIAENVETVSESARFTVEKSEFLDDWYVLSGTGWVCVEGHLSEWKQVAEAIRAGNDINFRRVACQKARGGVSLWSPRNAAGRDDYYLVSESELPALLASIDALEPVEKAE